MDITGAIESAEILYKQILEDFFISRYNEKSLPSHGINHHRRVWNYSKELLKLLPLNDSIQISELTSNLITASYLHDIGMSVDSGTKHGIYGRILCIEFLTKNNLPENYFRNALDAIEYHDNKNYNNKIFRNDLLRILSVSDDLDAFGYIGIFRYSEIYLTRSVIPEKLGSLILENVEKRFANFVKTLGSETAIVKKHRKRYNIIHNFFKKYDEQLPSYHFGTSNPCGYCGVIESIQLIMNNGLQLENFLTESDKYPDDPMILSYFAELKKELSDN